MDNLYGRSLNTLTFTLIYHSDRIYLFKWVNVIIDHIIVTFQSRNFFFSLQLQFYWHQLPLDCPNLADSILDSILLETQILSQDNHLLETRNLVIRVSVLIKEQFTSQS